jgi:hypothetical protein
MLDIGMILPCRYDAIRSLYDALIIDFIIVVKDAAWCFQCTDPFTSSHLIIHSYFVTALVNKSTE